MLSIASCGRELVVTVVEESGSGSFHHRNINQSFDLSKFVLSSHVTYDLLFAFIKILS